MFIYMLRVCVKFCRNLLFCAGFLVIAACGGGGGGGGGATSNTSAFDTAEYRANYGLASIGALKAYENNATGSGIIVAVIDSAIDQTHSDLAANISGASGTVGSISTGLQDTDGHGTAIAGIIAAVNNSIGTHGVAPSATIIALKASNDATALAADLAVGIDAAVLNGAKVINFSFGLVAFDATLATAVQNAVNAGIVVIASAGNSGNAQVT